MPTKTNIAVTTVGFGVTVSVAIAILVLAFNYQNALDPIIKNGLINFTNDAARAINTLGRNNLNIPSISGTVTFNNNPPTVINTGTGLPILSNAQSGTFISDGINIPLDRIYPEIHNVTDVITGFITPVGDVLGQFSSNLIIVLGALTALIALDTGSNFSVSGFLYGLFREHERKIKALEHRVFELEKRTGIASVSRIGPSERAIEMVVINSDNNRHNVNIRRSA